MYPDDSITVRDVVNVKLRPQAERAASELAKENILQRYGDRDPETLTGKEVAEWIKSTSVRVNMSAYCKAVDHYLDGYVGIQYNRGKIEYQTDVGDWTHPPSPPESPRAQSPSYSR